jgi:lysozyme
MRSRQKKILIRSIVYTTTVALLVLGAWLGYKWWEYRRAKFSRYPGFNIVIPGEYQIHGIDVSRYQSIIAWEEVKAMRVRNVQIGFAFIKATEGVGDTDPQFRRNWKKARSNDLVRGAYHFFIASKDGKVQAQNFIKRVDLQSGDLPPVIDVEQRNGVSVEQLKRELRKWLETVKNYYGVTPIIYTNVDFYDQYLGSEFDKYPLWAAHYYEEEQPRIKRDWLFWQHNDQGNVNGITSKVDFNVFIGDSLSFRNILVR